MLAGRPIGCLHEAIVPQETWDLVQKLRETCVVRNAAYQVSGFNVRERHNKRKNEEYFNSDIEPDAMAKLGKPGKNKIVANADWERVAAMAKRCTLLDATYSLIVAAASA